MIDDDLRQLNDRPLERSLQSLESEVWSGLARRAEQRAVARGRLSVQGAVMGLALVVSIAMGLRATRQAEHPAGPVMAFGLELTPSSLLLGSAR